MHTNLMQMVNGVWLMEPTGLGDALQVFDNKLNGEGLLALVPQFAQAEENAKPIQMDSGIAPMGNNGKTLIIPISGTLVPRTGGMKPYCGMFPTNALTENLESWTRGYDTVIFHIDSGGGMATGVMEAAEVIAHLPMRTIAFVDSVAASGAYWLASACEKVYAQPSARVGSIGAYVALTKLTDRGREAQTHKTHYFAKGENKVMFNPEAPLSEAESAAATKITNDSYESFVTTVARNRNIDRKVIDDMKSEVFQASTVVGTLVDGLATLQEVINGTT